MRFDKQEGCRRTEPRSAMHCDALAFCPDGRRLEVTISDMSLSGVRMEGGAFEDRDEFRLVIPHRGDVDARVRWSSADTAGAHFDEDVALQDAVPPRDRYAIKRLRAYNFSSGRTFGRRGVS